MLITAVPEENTEQKREGGNKTCAYVKQARRSTTWQTKRSNRKGGGEVMSSWVLTQFREPGRLHRTSWQLGTVPGANILGKKFSLSHK